MFVFQLSYLVAVVLHEEVMRMNIAQALYRCYERQMTNHGITTTDHVITMTDHIRTTTDDVIIIIDGVIFQSYIK